MTSLLDAAPAVGGATPGNAAPLPHGGRRWGSGPGGGRVDPAWWLPSGDGAAGWPVLPGTGAVDLPSLRAWVERSYAETLGVEGSDGVPPAVYAMGRVLLSAAGSEHGGRYRAALGLRAALIDWAETCQRGGRVRVYLEPNPHVVFLDQLRRPHRTGGRPAVILPSGRLAWFDHGQLLARC